MLEGIKSYVSESYDELKNKVSWPSWTELQSSAIIVAVASVIIALVIFIMDISFEYILKFIYSINF